MESGIKQNAVSYSSGMSNVPNNLLCSDDSCSEVVGLTSENGEMRPIQKAKKVFDVPSGTNKMLYVHQLQNKKVYIYLSLLHTEGYADIVQIDYIVNHESGTSVYLTQLGNVEYVNPDDVKVESIGNTLIVSSGKEIKYFLWKGSYYDSLGNKIPEPQVKFWLGGDIEEHVESTLSSEVINQSSYNNLSIKTDKEEDWNNVVYGDFYKLLNKVNQKKAFFSPFFALAALEMYDGSYYMATSPVALYPNFAVTFCSKIHHGSEMQTKMRAYELHFSQSTNYDSWSDIVKNVTIFVTEGINPCDMSQDADLTNVGASNSTSTGFLQAAGTRTQFTLYTNEESDGTYVYKVLNSKTDADIVKEMSELSVFYKLCDVGTIIHSSRSTAKFITAHTIENITVQTRLDVDGGEYFDHTQRFGETIYSYNGRLHIANIRRSFFDGFEQFISKDNNTTHTVSVAIETPMGTKIVSKSGVTGSVGHYFYYPDPRAKYVKIATQGESDIVLFLEEHSGLNGAYCIKSPLVTLTSDTGATFPSTNLFTGDYELLPNKVMVSEVDNPFVFRARGYNTVGKGEVVAITSNTSALSEGQFGQFPLLAFATDGIWALGTNSTGTYSTIAPMSREVCNNAKSVTQTDSAVFFTSEKGLMVVVGSQVKCVSEQMNGKHDSWGANNDHPEVTFKEFLEDCFIAYDYRDSMLWVANDTYDYTCYVYNIKAGTWAMVDVTNTIKAVISDYPDTLLQDDAGHILSLLSRKDQNKDTGSYGASITTRPMKFGNALTLKSIRQTKHLMSMNKNATLQVMLYASNDCRQWVQLQSLRGKPWKYYRVKYFFDNMKATDRFIGTVFVTQESRNDKLR